MNKSLIVLTILVVISAAIVHQLHRRIYWQDVPEGLNPNSTFPYRVIGFIFGVAKDLAWLGERLGLLDSYYLGIRKCFGLTAYLTVNITFHDQLEINNTEISGTKVRIYKPVNRNEEKTEKGEDELMPAFIYFHGGGWTIGSLDAYDIFLRRVAALSNVIVVSVAYRQAPEYIYPTSMMDCYNVAIELLNNGSQYGINVKRVMVGGDSAGGNIAAAVTHTLAGVAERHCSKQYLAGQILIYPALQMLDLNLPSYVKSKNDLIASQRDIADYVSLYLNGSTALAAAILAGNHSRHLENTRYMAYVRPKGIPDADDNDDDDDDNKNEVIKNPEMDLSEAAAAAIIDPVASPLLAKTFRGTPQTLLITAEFDPLRDEGFLYAERIKLAGVELVHKHYFSFHGFLTLTSEPSPHPFSTEEGRNGTRDVIEFLQRLKTADDLIEDSE